jgi:hypothetical protein
VLNISLAIAEEVGDGHTTERPTMLGDPDGPFA